MPIKDVLWNTWLNYPESAPKEVLTARKEQVPHHLYVGDNCLQQASLDEGLILFWFENQTEFINPQHFMLIKRPEGV